ncbi:30S ribosomal protein S17e [Candidatus Woesearchaeota archaeon]|nr:30S ribosomal protein S17e [Candidatus Woesearchaeota archaeon]
MGRIKTQQVKRITTTIFKRYGEKVTPDFGKNKQLLAQIATIYSKKIRNMIAGYLSRMARQKV